MSRHDLLIAAIFLPYMTLMSGLFAYIHRTGRPRAAEPEEQAEQDRNQAEIRLAA
jgi:hypothetical protein